MDNGFSLSVESSEGQMLEQYYVRVPLIACLLIIAAWHSKRKHHAGDSQHARYKNKPMLQTLLLPCLLQTLREAKYPWKVNRFGSVKLKKVNQQRNC